MDRSPQIVPMLRPLPGASALPLAEPQRRERSDATRNRLAILRAAERLVAARGVDVTMDEVACAAGVGKGTLFRHFGDRRGLLRALLDERERAFQEAFIRGPAPLGPGASARERLIAFGERMIEHIQMQGDLLADAESGAPGERLAHVVHATHRQHVVMLLDNARAHPDNGYLADVMLGALTAELVLHQLRVLDMSPEDLGRGWRELVLALLAAEPPDDGGRDAQPPGDGRRDA